GGAVARDARGFGAPAVLVDEGALVGEPLGGMLDLAQPVEGLGRLRLRKPGIRLRDAGEYDHEEREAPHRHGRLAHLPASVTCAPRSPGRRPCVRTAPCPGATCA